MISLEDIILYGFGLFLIFNLLICIICYYTPSKYPIVWRYKEEKSFIDGPTGKRQLFPSIDDTAETHLSVIIPAYNEEERLKPMLNECLSFLHERNQTSGLTYEVIVVSDGSTDKTVDIAQSYAKLDSNVKVLELVENRGKGGAVRLGMQSAQGALLLFADADGATKFSDLTKLEESMKSIIGIDYLDDSQAAEAAHGVVCGSRAHLEEEETAKRSIFRLILMHGFHFLVWSLCVRDIRDTQCGFKLFTRRSARILFGALHVERWAFDVELLYLAQTLNIPITEIAVTWTEIDGSKVVPFWSWLGMGNDLFMIWLRYKVGAWKIAKPNQSQS